jgi:hypothetical protein
MTTNQGIDATVDAMTEPSPRLTNTIGSVQQTSVVSAENNPRTAAKRFRIYISIQQFGHTTTTCVQSAGGESDQQRKRMEMWRVVRTDERLGTVTGIHEERRRINAWKNAEGDECNRNLRLGDCSCRHVR